MIMANTQIGKILAIGKAVNVSKRDVPFMKRELVLDASRYDEFTGEKRENYVTFQFTQKRCEELDRFNVGDLVEVSFILSGRSYDKEGQTKYITDIVGYKVELRGQQRPVDAAQQMQSTPPPPPPPAPEAFPPPQPQYEPPF